MPRLRPWTAGGVGFVQLRAKHLPAGELFCRTRAAAEELARLRRATGNAPQLLVNSRPDVALAAGADGVHLSSRPGELTPAQVRTLFRRPCTVSVSCHTPAEVRAAAEAGADFLLFGPVFEKRVEGTLVAEGVGLDALHGACRVAGTVPVLALGGVTPANTALCLGAGAAGVAGIRLFAAAGSPA